MSYFNTIKQIMKCSYKAPKISYFDNSPDIASVSVPMADGQNPYSSVENALNIWGENVGGI